jgi:hypothetical protein
MDELRRKLFEKIKQLLAMADRKHSNCTDAEAEVAMTKAKQLMTEHNIAMSDVDVEQLKHDPTAEQEAIVKGGFWSWDARLFRICDALFGTDHYRSKFYEPNSKGNTVKKERMFFYGLKADVELAVAVYSILYQMVWEMAKRYSRTVDKNAYLDGLTHCLLIRAQEFVPVASQNLTPQQQKATCTAIIVVKKDVLATMAKSLGLETKPNNRYSNRQHTTAYEHGYNDGKKINLNFRNTLK